MFNTTYNLCFRYTAYAMVVLMFLVSFGNAGTTTAYYNDSETSGKNIFTASSLDLSVVMEISDTTSRSVRLKNDGKQNFSYGVAAQEVVNPGVSFCNDVQVSVNGQASVPLLTLHTATTSLASSTNTLQTYVFLIGTQGANYTGQTCIVDFVYEASQDGFVYPQAYFDTEIDTVTLYGENFITVVAPPEPMPSVLINEIMWMGSDPSTADEWIELRNTTNAPIDLAGWKVDSLGTATTSITIPSGIIGANDFFLIANYATNASEVNDAITADYVTTGIALANTPSEQLVLKNSSDAVIDLTPIGTSWAEGVNGANKQSMQRNLVPGDGLIASNWNTCTASECNDGTYWDVNDGVNYGTPKSANITPVLFAPFSFVSEVKVEEQDSKAASVPVVEPVVIQEEDEENTAPEEAVIEEQEEEIVSPQEESQEEEVEAATEEDEKDEKKEPEPPVEIEDTEEPVSNETPE